MALEIPLTIAISMLPISELRGAIPYALYNNVPAATAYSVSVISNIIIVPIVFLFLNYVNRHLLAIPLYSKIFRKLIERTRRKSSKYVEKWGYLGLALFVAVPLPVTGAYTGALAAWVFGMKQKKAFLSIALGVAIAGIIVTMAAVTGMEALKIFVLRKAI